MAILSFTNRINFSEYTRNLKIRKSDKLPQLRKEIFAPSVVKIKIAFLDTN